MVEIITNEEFKKLKSNFKLCSYESDGSCNCGNKNQKNGKRLWIEKKFSKYYCDFCGLMKLCEVRNSSGEGNGS